ncbi:MAG: septation regulator SpoVG [Oscillospiraceae bacterium]|nr:septation regulator SpoVG [Oscillospiraceae bacterium]
MEITNIRIRKLYEESRLKALVSVTLGQELAIHDIKVIQGPQRLFVAMPSRKDENGVFRDIIHPISQQTREQLEEAVLLAYEEEKAANDLLKSNF